jgi:flagellar hook-associated protein 1 FlgK
MAGLSTALTHALSGLTVSAAQTAVTARNVSFAGEPDYVRRVTQVSTLSDGSAVLAATTRSVDGLLQADALKASADSSGQSVVLDAYGQLSATVGEVSADGSLAAGINALAIRLADYEADPSSQSLAGAAVMAAKDVAQGLNDATATVQNLRAAADQAIAQSVNTINSLLQRFQAANQTVINSNSDDAARNDALDQRDAILSQLAQEIGIRTVKRGANDVAIYTDSGVTLFETTARQVTFQPTGAFSATTTGSAVYADGVRITGDGSVMPSAAGKLQAQVMVRDRMAPQYQSQLDEVARGLVSAFAEHDQSGAGLPAVTGLFSHGGSPAVPAAGVAVPGLAATIAVNPAALATPQTLRDGGFGGAAYVYNSTGAAGYQARLTGLINALSAPQGFDPAAGMGTSGTVDSMARSSAAWLEQGRSSAEQSAIVASARAARAREALQRVTGVNIDEEMTRLLDLDKAYQASAKVMTIVNQMMQQLVNVV